MFEINILIQSFICLFMALMARKRDNYSIASSMLIFYLIFLIITPIVTKNFNINYWGFSSTPDLYDDASFITLLFLIFYVISYEFFYRKPTQPKKKKELFNKNVNWLKIYFLLFAILVFQFSIRDFDLNRVFIRDYSTEEITVSLSTIEWLINMTVLQTMPTILFLYLYFYNKIKFTKNHQIVILFFILLIAPPTALPRFMAGAIYIPILYVYFFEKKHFDYKIVIIILLLLTFPLLDATRTFAIEKSLANISATSLILGNFSQGHLDAYQSIMMSSQIDNFYYGSQIIGSFLFFIPRAWWESKPIGSGQEIADTIGLNFNNISLSLPAEFYINFWYYGVIIGAILLAGFSARLDKNFRENNYSSFTKVFYIIFVPLILLCMRGDMLSAVSFTTGIVISCYIWIFILRKNFRTA